MLWNVVECCGMLWNVVNVIEDCECCGMLWNVVECCGMLWNAVNVIEGCKMLWHVVGSYEIT